MRGGRCRASTRWASNPSDRNAYPHPQPDPQAYLSSKSWTKVDAKTATTPMGAKAAVTTFVSLSQTLSLFTLDTLCAPSGQANSPLVPQ